MTRPTGKCIHGILWAFFLFFGFQLQAQSTREVAVEITAVKTANNHTELRWKSDTGVIRYFVYKRPHTDSNWVLLDSMAATTLKFTDTQSRIGSSIEYRVAKKKNNFSFLGNGYITAGFNLPAQSDKGIVLLIIDSNYVVTAKQDIHDYIAQLQNEGFEVVKKSVLRTESVSNIKSWIFQQYQKDTQRLKCVLLMGHVPVPYSGDISPDGHTDHRGAWPADNYYGSFYSSWTDITVNRTTASRPANRNTPGDGKFDLSRLNPVGTTWKNTKRYQLPVGRIDFYDMPAFGSDTLLLKRYIKKNLAFRTKQVSFSPKGLVDDNFGYFAGEAFASGGYRNFSTFFGDSIVDADYAGTGNGMKSTKYLWSYGCGGGSYTSCWGVSNSTAMAQDSLLNPFTMVFGSYFGDWDNQNNFLRSPIASKGWGLASVWSGRPYWLMHESALGAPLYESVKSTYNCTNLYSVGAFGAGHVHVALMGDPTLRVFPVANLLGVTAKADCSGKLLLQWQKSTDQADSIIIERWQNNQWNPFGTAPGVDTQFVKTLSQGKHQVSLREKKLMQSASGSWWDIGARTIKEIFVNFSDTPRISQNALKLCEKDTFRFKATVGKQSTIVGWVQNGNSMGNKDSVCHLASQGQGNILIQLLVKTDSGCVSSDSVLVRSIPSDQLQWGQSTDSTIQVISSLKLPVAWYLNDTLIANEKDSVLTVKRSGRYQARTLSEGFCESFTDTLRYTLPPLIESVPQFGLTALCNENVRLHWQYGQQPLDSVILFEQVSQKSLVIKRLPVTDTSLFFATTSGKHVYGIRGKKQVQVISGMRWDLGPITWDSILISPKDTVSLSLIGDTLLRATAQRPSSWIWYRNDTLLQGATVSSWPVKLSGLYRACSLHQDSCLACSDTLRVVVKPTMENITVQPLAPYRIYPNPCAQILQIEGQWVNDQLPWQIFDLRGDLLLEGTGNVVDVNTLDAGCYAMVIDGKTSLLFFKS